MTFNRVMVWKFDSAPDELRALHKGRQSPSWLAFVPKTIGGADLEAAIIEQTRLLDHLDRHQTEAGDIIYFCSCDSAPLLGAIDLIRLDDFTQNPDLRLGFSESKEEATERSEGSSST
jgi:hypothetical protein